MTGSHQSPVERGGDDDAERADTIDVMSGSNGDQTDFSGDDLVIGYPGLDEPVIDGESIAVPPDEVTALIGPNGSGKSTLLRGLADKVAPDDGTVLLDGRTIDEFGSKELARKLGLLSQENVVPTGISVEDLVERGRYPHTGFFESLSDEDREAVEEAIELAGVEHLRERDVDSLSGGQKQFVWIAMVLAQDTDVLLLDEPTTFLDPHHQLEVMEIVETLRDRSDTTVVVVLHDINQAARYADHVVALKDGTVHARGPPEDVITEDRLAAERQAFLVEATREDARVAVGHRSLVEYTYRDLEPTYPVLVAAVRLDSVCADCQRAVRDHLTRRA